MQTPLLDVRNLNLSFRLGGRWCPTVEDVSYQINAGETLGIVGESGSGKSVSSMALLGFTGRARGQKVGGQALYKGQDLLTMSDKQLQGIRGKEIAMVFQEPMTSLDPSFKIGDQIAAAVRRHRAMSWRDARIEAVRAMDMVRIPNAALRADSYPHEFSGGMRQRVLIAMAMVNRPSVLIADEPTTALDVSVQAQVLNLLKDMQKELGLAIIFISHNMGVIADICDRVAVMYAGQIVEDGEVHDIFARPRHPYTKRLLSSMPSMEKRQGQLEWIEGSPPPPTRFPTGCRFAPRCLERRAVCDTPPTLVEYSAAHWTRCQRYHDFNTATAESQHV